MRDKPSYILLLQEAGDTIPDVHSVGKLASINDDANTAYDIRMRSGA